MKSILIAVQMLCAIACGAQAGAQTTRMEAEYYVAAYAEHYRVPVALARAIVERESNWHVCTISPKGAVGLMQLMPITAQRLGVSDRCNPSQNVSGGVRYLAWLMRLFHNDLRLVAAAYYAGEDKIIQRGLSEIPMSSHMSQELEQLIFVNPGMNRRTNSSRGKGMCDEQMFEFGASDNDLLLNLPSCVGAKRAAPSANHEPDC